QTNEKRIDSDEEDLGLDSDSDGDIGAIMASSRGQGGHKQKKKKHADDWKDVEITRPLIDPLDDDEGRPPGMSDSLKFRNRSLYSEIFR
ncbi:hypothetical protein SARC_18270, partial [Sphaeroforma arctica JP610]